MSRWIGSWLSGSGAALESSAATGNDTRRRWPGDRLGLPENGAGSVPGTGSRVLALLIDLVLAALVAGLFTAPRLPGNWSVLSWAMISIVGTALFGFTPGMAVLRVRAARVDGSALVGVPRAVLRTALIFLIVPAVIMDADMRGLHDKATGTVVVRRR